MNPIRQLPKEIAEKIAAGEVVTGPLSVVKELTENAVDAGASLITIEIREGGKTMIRVTDNGSGIPPEQMELAFAPHATSKIRDAEDLDHIGTLGFRGEALASIAAVSKMEMTTKTAEGAGGMFLAIAGGAILEQRPVGAADGTTLVVRDLFYNTPARLKFLKSERSETTKIIDFVSRMAVAYPHIRVRMISGGNILFSTGGQGDTLQAILTVYGGSGDGLIPLEAVSENSPAMRLRAYISGPAQSRNSRKSQVFFVNGRAVVDENIGKAVAKAYREFLFAGRFPIVYLFLQVAPDTVDVNVHPAKSEIRFHEVAAVADFIEQSLNQALSSKEGIPAALTAKEKSRRTREGKAFFGLAAGGEAETAAAKEPGAQGRGGVAGFGGADGAPGGGHSASGGGTDADAMAIGVKGGNAETEIDAMAKDFYPETVRIDDLWSGASTEAASGPTARVAEPPEDTTYPSADSRPVSKGVQEELAIESLQVLGVAFATYLIAMDADNFYFVDQHAAHERVNYEAFLARYRAAEQLQQQLLTPAVLQLPAAMKPDMDGWIALLNRLGFESACFGENAIVVKSFPAFLEYAEGERFLEDILSGTDGPPENEKAVERLISRACKQSVKANQLLKDAEIKALLRDLSQCENPYTCPHGRPVFLKLTKSDIARLFRR